MFDTNIRSEFGKKSSILKDVEEIKQLQQWVEESAGGKVRFELLWKGGQDGFGAAMFHSKCNGKGPTVTVIKSNNDKIFGGYTSESWGFGGSSGAYKQDATAFIYSLTHKAKCATQKNTGYSIFDRSSFGPLFGSGRDIVISDNCNATTNNCCESQRTNSPYSTYALPSGADNTFLAGSKNFTVKEIEVYAVIKQ